MSCHEGCVGRVESESTLLTRYGRPVGSEAKPDRSILTAAPQLQSELESNSTPNADWGAGREERRGANGIGPTYRGKRLGHKVPRVAEGRGAKLSRRAVTMIEQVIDLHG